MQYLIIVVLYNCSNIIIHFYIIALMQYPCTVKKEDNKFNGERLRFLKNIFSRGYKI